MSCKYNNCKHCGYKSECEIFKENAELRAIAENQQSSNMERYFKNKELEKENAELKAKNKWYSEQVCNKECAEVWGNLTKAKKIIKNLMVYVPVDLKEYEEAKQFLSEVK